MQAEINHTLHWFKNDQYPVIRQVTKVLLQLQPTNSSVTDKFHEEDRM